MMTPKEIFLEMLKPDGQPERILDQYEALTMYLRDPINAYLRAGRKRGVTSVDRWGVTILFPEDAPGAIPDGSKDKKVLKDITKWREYVHAPDIAANCTEGWEEARREARELAGDQKLVAGFMGQGIFEHCHYLMGFETCLTEFYEHPQEMHELIDYITEFRMLHAKMLIEGLQPDVLFTHDDWGAKEALFMKPDMWREFFKEPYERFYGYIRSQGVIAIHHADSYLVPIIDDMVEMGIQCWQGALPENDIPALQRHLKGKMVMMGGIGATIDRADATEEEIRSYVRQQLETYCPGGHFIPSITYGMPGTVFKHVDPFIDDEIAKYNSILHMPKATGLPEIPRRVEPGSEAAAAAVGGLGDTGEGGDDDGADLMGRIASALYKGQRNRTVALVREAADAGEDPQDIISQGLMPGMEEIGEDFTSGDVFVPEMLMSARCMSEALEVLKPLLLGDGGQSVGKVALGTIQGDLHDIGKNLVKIMMEGNGFEIVDLGSDVAPERFVQAAKEENCDIIACSALLTTSMVHIEDVVKLAEEAGIRDKVKIMVGGAPITQEFCDKIGADCYTDDAAEAARAAVALMRG